MDLFFSLMVSPAAFAALMAALYWVYPTPLLHGYKKFGGYLYAGLSRKFKKVGNINYSYFERLPSGDSKITVVFVHGFSANKTMWMDMSRHLPKSWHLVMVDMPGHGESSFDPNGDYTAHGMADFLDQFIEAMGLTNIHLVGVSMGSLISTRYACKYQHKVKSISIMCIPVAHMLPEGVKTEFFKEMEEGRVLIMPKNAEEFQQMLELVLYNPSPYTFHHRFREAVVEIQKENYDYMYQIMDQLNNDKLSKEPEIIRQFARSVSSPTLILWGKDDKICHPSGAAITGQLIKDSKVVMLDKCGHAMTMDRPRKCAKLVQEFIHHHHHHN